MLSLGSDSNPPRLIPHTQAEPVCGSLSYKFLLSEDVPFFLRPFHVPAALSLIHIYNRITKLKKAGAPPKQIGRAQAALKEFRKEALLRKQQVKEKKLPATQFISWMIGQEAVIEGICKG